MSPCQILDEFIVHHWTPRSKERLARAEKQRWWPRYIMCWLLCHRDWNTWQQQGRRRFVRPGFQPIVTGMRMYEWQESVRKQLVISENTMAGWNQGQALWGPSASQFTLPGTPQPPWYSTTGAREQVPPNKLWGTFQIQTTAQLSLGYCGESFSIGFCLKGSLPLDLMKYMQQLSSSTLLFHLRQMSRTVEWQHPDDDFEV